MADLPAADGCPLTRLPTELLEAICLLVAEDETRPVLRIEIEQDAATQQKTPRISAFVPGLGGTCRRLRWESSAALKRHIVMPMTSESGVDRPHLVSPTVLHHEDSWRDGIVAKALQIYASAASEIRHDKKSVHKVHVVAAFIPIIVRSTTVGGPNLAAVKELVVIFVTDGSQSKLRADRLALAIPQQQLSNSITPSQWPSLEAVTALDEIKQAVKGTKWAGNMRYYTIWFDYVVRYTKNLY
jgi:hypothetical protein